MAADSSVTLTVTALVESEGEYSGVAEVAAAGEKDPDSTPNNGLRTEDDHVEYSISPVPVADLALSQTVDDDTAVVGTEVILTTRLSNAGPSDATRVVVTRRLPDGLAYVGDDGGGAYSPRTGKWKVGRLAAGDDATLVITAKVQATGDYAITAEITEANQQDPDSAPDNGATAEDDYVAQRMTPVALADLSLAQVVDNPTPDVGGNVVFALTVRNNGPSDATGVVVTDQLPSGYRYLRHKGPGVYDDESGEWTIGALASGSAVTLEITAKVNARGEYQNVAEITGCDQRDPDSRPGDRVAGQPESAGEPMAPLSRSSFDSGTLEIGSSWALDELDALGGFSEVAPRRLADSYVEPTYPALLRENRIPGQVRLMVLVRSDGTVGDVEVIEALPRDKGFEEAAIEAVRQWRYEPATTGGRPVDHPLTVLVNFR